MRTARIYANGAMALVLFHFRFSGTVSNSNFFRFPFAALPFQPVAPVGTLRCHGVSFVCGTVCWFMRLGAELGFWFGIGLHAQR